MPPPLGKVPTKKMPNIQVFGTDDSAATRNALRFFRERRIVVHYVDLRKKPSFDRDQLAVVRDMLSKGATPSAIAGRSATRESSPRQSSCVAPRRTT